MDPRQSPNRRLVELQEENDTLKSKIAELSEQLNKTNKELSDVKERLTLSEQVTIATQRRELQQAGIYDKLLAENVYEKLRSELKEDHVYAKLQPSLLCHYSSVYDNCFI